MATESQPVKTVTLKYPYTFGDKNIKECNFIRRPKAKDLKGLSLTDMKADDQLLLLGKMTDLSTPELGEMDLADFQDVSEALASFLPNTQEAGKTT